MTVVAEVMRNRKSAGRRPMRRAMSVLALAIGWIVAAPLLALALGRIVAWDDLEPFVIANTITAFVYLPAYLIGPVALLCRRRLLALACLAVVIAQIAFMLPELTAARSVPSWAQSETGIRLFDANVYDGNPSVAGYVGPLERAQADVVTLEEANPNDFRQLVRAGAFQDLPYRFAIDRWDPWAFVIASRYRLHATRVVSAFDRPLIVETTVEAPNGEFSLWIVHTVAPLPSSWRQWSDQLAEIAALVRRDHPRHLLLVGDFNATWGNRAFRSILADGLTDGAAARGEPFLMTWSQMMSPLPPFVRIDHVIAGPGVAIKRVGAGHGPGSDHRYLTATVAVKR